MVSYPESQSLVREDVIKSSHRLFMFAMTHMARYLVFESVSESTCWLLLGCHSRVKILFSVEVGCGNYILSIHLLWYGTCV